MYDITLTNKHFFLLSLNNSTQCQIVAIFFFLFSRFFPVGSTVTFIYISWKLKSRVTAHYHTGCRSLLCFSLQIQNILNQRDKSGRQTWSHSKKNIKNFITSTGEPSLHAAISVLVCGDPGRRSQGNGIQTPLEMGNGIQTPPEMGSGIQTPLEIGNGVQTPPEIQNSTVYWGPLSGVVQMSLV